MTEPRPQAEPLALYAHVPWCVRKCPYCDFNSHPLRGPLPAAAYVDALLEDLDADLAWQPSLRARPVASIFLGGGTPSLLPPEAVSRLLEGIGARLPLAPGCEITLEANPGTVDAPRLRALRATGVDRLSIGAQSFDDALLARIGRLHTAAETRAAVAAAEAAGIERLNLDLMYALPGQDPGGAEADLRAAVALGPEHISWYQLTLEPNTAFGHSPPPLPDEASVLEMEMRGRDLLAAAGFTRYEVSAYARGADARCRHNLACWRFGDYLGLGAGAHGKLTRPDGAVVRTRRLRDPRRYLAAAPASRVAREPVPASRVPLEFALGAFRLAEGFTLTEFEARTGLPAERLAPALERAETLGLVERTEGGRVRASARGYALLDSLLALFVEDEGSGGTIPAPSRHAARCVPDAAP